MYQCSNHKNKFMQLELKCNYSNGLRELQKTNSRCWTIRLTMTPSGCLYERLGIYGCTTCLGRQCDMHTKTIEESLIITTLRCDLAIVTHAGKIHRKLFVVVHQEVLDND